MRLVFKHKNTIQIVTLAVTKNNKIESNRLRKIVQTYTFSYKQFELVKNRILTNESIGMANFFNSADTNCLDCPFNEYQKCYTHKFNQYNGFISSLKSVVKQYGTIDNIPTFDSSMLTKLIKMSNNTYVRFGSYGEPSLHPIEMIIAMSEACTNWTGYTHQYSNNDLGKYFMASTHTIADEIKAKELGYRSFVATESKLGYVSCPASKESNKKSNCSSCNLCSGTLGTKSKKSIEILLH
jgi:hypothetical protein